MNMETNDHRVCGMMNPEAPAQEDDLCISSIQEAAELLARSQYPGGAQLRRRLVEYITNPDNEVACSCDKYHNFILDLFHTGDFMLGLKVCDYVLTFAPQHCDIIGDALHACGESCQFERGNEYMRLADDIPIEYWSYRLFLFYIRFLTEKRQAFRSDPSIFRKAMELADEYISHFPYDEHGYNQRAELLVAMNQRDDAIEALKSYIKEVTPNQDDVNSQLTCAQCCVTLLNLLDDSNDYDYIIEVCELGLLHTTQEQPSAKIGFFMYRKALALDAKAHREGFCNWKTIMEALRCYQTAYDLNQHRAYSNTIEIRYALLRPYAAELGFNQPLMKRPLFVVTDADGREQTP